jgi:putative lipoic acid-binding regulatory protein
LKTVADAPKIEFPCDYPIKVIGVNHRSLRATVVEIVRHHAPDLAEESISLRDSRAGRYCSVRMSITATGEPQLQALHQALLAEPLVKLVL